MKTTNEYLQKLKRFKEQHSSEYGIERIGLFGSVARGEHTENSDVDVCVEMKPDIYFLISVRDDLQKVFKRKVDIVRVRKNMNPFLLKTINNTAVYA